MCIEITALDKIEENIPCYCFRRKCFCHNIEKLHSILGEKIGLNYSVKANPFFSKAAMEYLDGLEICSLGELHLVISSGIKADKILFGGICKEKREISEALETGVQKFSVESFSQLQQMDEMASKYGIEAEVLLRLSVGNQFGMELQEIKKCFNKHIWKNIRIKGGSSVLWVDKNS